MSVYESRLQEMDIVITHDKTSWVGKAIAFFTSRVADISSVRVDHVHMFLFDDIIIESTIGGVQIRGLKGYNPKNFTLYIARYKNMNDELKNKLYKALIKKAGMKYSYLQLLLLGIKYLFKLKHIPDASKSAFVCSELVAAVFAEVGEPITDLPPHEFSPAHFFNNDKFTVERIF